MNDEPMPRRHCLNGVGIENPVVFPFPVFNMAVSESQHPAVVVAAARRIPVRVRCLRSVRSRAPINPDNMCCHAVSASFHEDRGLNGRRIV